MESTGTFSIFHAQNHRTLPRRSKQNVMTVVRALFTSDKKKNLLALVDWANMGTTEYLLYFNFESLFDVRLN